MSCCCLLLSTGASGREGVRTAQLSEARLGYGLGGAGERSEEAVRHMDSPFRMVGLLSQANE